MVLAQEGRVEGSTGCPFTSPSANQLFFPLILWAPCTMGKQRSDLSLLQKEAEVQMWYGHFHHIYHRESPCDQYQDTWWVCRSVSTMPRVHI